MKGYILILNIYPHKPPYVYLYIVYTYVYIYVREVKKIYISIYEYLKTILLFKIGKLMYTF